ncbi:hypothetical protein FACS1894139_04620 [Planctomycetales bacterium]|nr:hypothetical protein FACS1894107_09100 [Planctomycetales bacterium]GHS99039.1 hypothetical protein FACS1894108_08280 [Planctomycetales bacterium]GHT03700.1 hypothetical protein FACS1894139_04620 [Planctomycetales bacterium]
MKRLLFWGGLSAVAIAVVGCSSSSPVAEAMSAIADDAAAQLTALYPPAKTQFAAATPRDGFGVALLARLRERGYAIEESNRDGTGRMKFTYEINADSADGILTALYQVNDELLSRAYTANAANYAPLTAWTLRKGNIQ